MGEVEEVQEQIKADMEALKEKMAMMMEVNAAAIVATGTIAEGDLTPHMALTK